jgi:signal peptidase II
MRLLYLIVASAVLVLDQLTKRIVVAQFDPNTVVPVIPGLFRLVLVENRGMAFGLFADSGSNAAFVILLLFSAAALGFVGFLLWRSHLPSRASAIGLALILGGAAGNFLDRLMRGTVVDFLDFYVRTYHWPAFNLADSAIVVGAGILLLDLFWGRDAKLNPDCVPSENR